MVHAHRENQLRSEVRDISDAAPCCSASSQGSASQMASISRIEAVLSGDRSGIVGAPQQNVVVFR